MRRPGQVLAVCAICALSSLSLCAQQSGGEVVAFHFVRTGLPVPDFTLTVNADGSGTYTASYISSTPTSKYAPQYSGVTAAPPVETTRPITLSPKTTSLLFERARNPDGIRAGCESKAKNIADTGAKTLTYTSPEGSIHCTFNYTENKTVAAMTETIQGIAETLDEGRSIEQAHRFDRLGLDHQLSTLADNVRDGRALEVGTISQVLQSLCDDTQVMDRVRKRAASLLQASANAH